MRAIIKLIGDKGRRDLETLSSAVQAFSMDLTQLSFLWMNFLAPAAAVAGLLGLLTPLFWRRRPQSKNWTARLAINFAVGTSTLALAAWGFGHDGKMLAYAAMVVAVASSQWVLMRGWRG